MTVSAYKQYKGEELKALMAQHQDGCRKYRKFVEANPDDVKLMNKAEPIKEAIDRLDDDDWNTDPRVHIVWGVTPDAVE